MYTFFVAFGLFIIFVLFSEYPILIAFKTLAKKVFDDDEDEINDNVSNNDVIYDKVTTSLI